MIEYENNDARKDAEIKDLQPSPGEGVVGGGTQNPLVTETKDVGRGTPIDVFTPDQEGIKVERNPVNFVGGIKIKGKELEDYMDSHGGVTEEEMESYVEEQIGSISSGTKLYKHEITMQFSPYKLYIVSTENTPVVSFNELVSLFENCISHSYNSSEGKIVIIKFIDDIINNMLYAFGILGNVGTDLPQFAKVYECPTSMFTIADTVTEL